jgi:polyisoprenoid-binding protein YceI
MIPVPGRYEVDPVHTFVEFSTRHLLVGRVDGRFDSFAGGPTIVEDPEPLFGPFEVTFAAASVDTRVETRDEDLRSQRFFDADSFPALVLRGGTSRQVSGARWSVQSQLTIRDVTRDASLDVTVRGVAVDGGKSTAALAVSAAIQRADYGMTAELLEESGPPGTGADVEIKADVEAFLVAEG